MGPWQVWLPPIVFGLLFGLLGVFGVLPLGPCIGSGLLVAGIAMIFIGTGVGLATNPYVLLILDAFAAFLIFTGWIFAYSAGVC